jgi:predicted Zn-dependent protease
MIEAATTNRTDDRRPAYAMATRLAALAISAAMLLPAPLRAQHPGGGPKLNIIRDTEIEELLREYTRPILKVAKLGGQNIEVVLIGDRSFNAFVADGRRIFVNIGALYEAETPNQIIGVLAHETGHIAGGHLARLRDQIASAQTASIVAMLLAMGAGVAGVATNTPGMGQAMPGLMLGPQEMIRRSLLGYVRQQEESADRAAVNFLNATGQSTKGMLETFARFADQTMFVSRTVDPYTVSHPMPRERIAALENLARTSPHFTRADPPQLQARHDMMRAKLSGFVDRPDAVFRRYPPSNNSMAARYARAISGYRNGNIRDAIANIDALIADQQNNP